MPVADMIGPANPSASHREGLHSTDDDIALVEMANLSTEKTGVDGVIDISTSQGSPAAPSSGIPVARKKVLLA